MAEVIFRDAVVESFGGDPGLAPGDGEIRELPHALEKLPVLRLLRSLRPEIDGKSRPEISIREKFLGHLLELSVQEITRGAVAGKGYIAPLGDGSENRTEPEARPHLERNIALLRA